MASIRPEFRIPTLTEDATDNCDEIAAALSTALIAIEKHLPPKTREHALVITKLQEAQQWAERGIAQVPENQEA